MPVSPDKIKELLDRKTQPRESGIAVKATTKTKKFIRLDRQYPRLPEDGNVSRTDSINLHCASRGCRGATCYCYKGAPYCTTHLILLLAIENTRLSKLIEGDNGNSDSGTTDFTERFTASEGTL